MAKQQLQNHLGGSVFQKKWGTPDVLGAYKYQPGEVVNFPLELVSGEVKIDPGESVVAFGQAVAYRLFSHKVYIAMPRTMNDADKDRLATLCHLFGVGLVFFDLKPPDAHLPHDFRALPGPVAFASCLHQENPKMPAPGQGLGLAPFAGIETAMKKHPIKENPRVGSSFESWLDEEGIRAEVEERSGRRALAMQLAQAMAKRGVSQMELARRMKTSRAVVQRVLDCGNPSLTFKTAQKATAALGLHLVVRVEEDQAKPFRRERELVAH